MRTEFVQPTGNVTLTLSEVSMIINLMENQTGMSTEFGTLKRDFKDLYKQMTGRDYGTRGIDVA